MGGELESSWLMITRSCGEGLRNLIERCGTCRIVAECADGFSAVEKRPSFRRMRDHGHHHAGLNGIEATRKIIDLKQGTKVIILSMHDDRRFVTETLKAGASGYLLKDSAFQDLEKALSCVMAGTVYLSPRIASIVVNEFIREPSALQEQTLRESPSWFCAPREREVPSAPVRGEDCKGNRRILSISLKTGGSAPSEYHAQTQSSQCRRLTRYAIQEGIIQP
jgi:DNA-binding NarL/FixJ family response regulator